MDSLGVHRPRNVDWKRAAALLYGDWGTSKAYVVGFAFSSAAVAIAWQSLPGIVAGCALSALVAVNYILVCRHFPEGGGVYSAAREQSRVPALTGVEAIANLAGVRGLDPRATMEKPRVARASTLAISVVAVEVVFGTALLGWSMLSLPYEMEPTMRARWEDMLNVLAEHYG